MHPSLRQASLRAFAVLSPDAVAALLADARMLRGAALRGTAQPWLRGRNLGLLCAPDAAADADATLFREAAAELGATVAQLHTRLAEPVAPPELQHTARLLGRLYDALECQRMPAEVVQRLRRHADVPVFDGLASPGHPTARIAELLDGEAAWADKRRFVLQAVLVCTLAG